MDYGISLPLNKLLKLSYLHIYSSKGVHEHYTVAFLIGSILAGNVHVGIVSISYICDNYSYNAALGIRQASGNSTGFKVVLFYQL